MTGRAPCKTTVMVTSLKLHGTGNKKRAARMDPGSWVHGDSVRAKGKGDWGVRASEAPDSVQGCVWSTHKSLGTQEAEAGGWW